MRKGTVLSLLLLLIFSPLQGEFKFPQPETEEEALTVRRIFNFWQDREYSFVKEEIESLLEEHPDSRMTD